MPAAQVAVVAIKPKPNKAALAALTTAALSLPGLKVQAAVPADRIQGNVSYGHYQESDERIQVDVYRANALIPLSDRLEFSFSLDRDTYSGATPSFSLPLTMTNQPKYKQKDDGTPADELSRVDIVSAASGGVTTGGLTVLGGLNNFQRFIDGNATGQGNLDNLSSKLEADTENAKLTLDTAFNANSLQLAADFQAELSASDPVIAAFTAQFNADKAVVEANIAAVPGTIDAPATITFFPPPCNLDLTQALPITRQGMRRGIVLAMAPVAVMSKKAWSLVLLRTPPILAPICIETAARLQRHWVTMPIRLAFI